MAKRNFNEWLGTFRESINGFKYYTDFETVYKNAEKYKIELNILNSLVGSQTIKKDFTNLIEKYPECLKAIPLLLAVRENEMYCQDEIVSKNFTFHEPYDEITDYIYFMEHTGLFDLIQNHLVSNLYDYVTGVEVGLGSNGRKNRGGHQMEDLVEGFIKETEYEYYKEMYLQDIEKKWNIDLSSISANNTTTKRCACCRLTRFSRRKERRYKMQVEVSVKDKKKAEKRYQEYLKKMNKKKGEQKK